MGSYTELWSIIEKWEAYHILREMVERGISTAVPNQIHGDIPYSMMGAAV